MEKGEVRPMSIHEVSALYFLAEFGKNLDQKKFRSLKKTLSKDAQEVADAIMAIHAGRKVKGGPMLSFAEALIEAANDIDIERLLDFTEPIREAANAMENLKDWKIIHKSLAHKIVQTQKLNQEIYDELTAIYGRLEAEEVKEDDEE